uniref:Uncharacterized protein n=1 Tax=Spongospora subterranea TaxID=70186 RepID=A0A0H5RQK4_9EUKA|eukprot:CRZ10989.1 hypothetical protein [Spongospora subterranea]
MYSIPQDDRPVIVFDWDDTLLASTDLSCCGYRVDSNDHFPLQVQSELRALESSVADLLQLAIDSGHVFIVTNSEYGWVEMSAHRFLPAVVPLLGHIQVISARSLYERQYPGLPAQWKMQAFFRLSEALKGRTVLSFGDSHVEREAVYAATSMQLNSKTVSVKFVDRPSLAQLCIQIDLVKQAKTWSYLCTPESDLDLVLSINM